MKIVIPMAGYGKRLRPLTLTRPKPLLTVADKPVLGHVLDMFAALPSIDEAVFIVGHLGDQIERYVAQSHTNLRTRFVEQKDRIGQSHAIWLAREGLEGPMLMVFVDTLIDADLSFLENEKADAVAWVCEVPDPRRFGVARLGAANQVTRLIEKPQDMSENLAVVGFYYFRDAARLIAAIDEQMERKIQLKGEYFLVDAINLMLEDGLQMRVQQVDAWHDCGTPQAMLETNRYLLENGRDNSGQSSQQQGLEIVHPVYVAPSAVVRDSRIGPYASIGPSCIIQRSSVLNSIVEAGSRITDGAISDSLLGKEVRVAGRYHALYLGDGVHLKPSEAHELEGS